MLHVLYGEDDFSRTEALRVLKAELGPEVTASNTTVLDGVSLSLAQLQAACDALPFFYTIRLVVVHGLLGRFEPRHGKQPEKRSKGSDAELVQNISAYVQHMSPGTELVLMDDDIKASNPLLKLLTPHAKVHSYPLLKGQQLQAWVSRRAQAGGIRMAPSAIRLLVEHVGPDLWTMSNELDKLLLYTSGAEVSESDVVTAINKSREASDFAFFDALMGRQLGTAQRLLHQIMDEGKGAQSLLSFMARQFGLILRAKEATLQGLSRQELQSILGTSSQFAVDKLVTQAKTTDMSRLRMAYELLLDADLKLKTSVAGEEMTLDVLVADLCRA